MADKTGEKPRPQSSDFQTRETQSITSPDFPGRQDKEPVELEWHTKNPHRPDFTTAETFAEVQLPPAPVDLTLEDSPAKESDHTNIPTPETDHESRPGTAPRNIGLVDEPPTFAEPHRVVPVPAKEPPRSAKAEARPMAIGVDELDSVEIVGPTGLALSDGKILRFPGGPRFGNGDLIEFNGHGYRVKLQKKKPPIFYVKILALVLLAALAVYGASAMFSGGPTRAVVGVVLDGATGTVLADAQIVFPNGTTAMTNAAGIFMVPHVMPGDYQIKAAKPGYAPRTVTVSTATSTAAVSISLNPTFAASDEEKKEESANKKSADTGTATAYGTLVLELDFDDYLVYLDERLNGKNVTKIGKIQPGEHRITVEKSQFEDYHTTVEIKARRTTNLTIALENLKRKTTPQQRAKTHFADGKSALDRGLYQEAIRNFDAALAETPEDAEARQYRGWAHRKVNNAEQATKDLAAAADLYALGNRYLEATTCAKYLIEMHPGDGQYYILRGDYLSALGELKSAIADYEIAVDLDKKSLAFQLTLAEGYYRDQQFKEAARIFEKARKLTADPTDVYVRLILSYMYAGKDKDLVKRYREFAEIAPTEKLERLERDPEWKRVLQLVRPEELH